MTSRLFPRTPRLDGPDAATVRRTLRDYFTATFDRYESLFETLASEETYVRKPIPLRHPLIFYFGHTATFFINKLLLARLVQERLNPRFESMFAVGVDEMSWDDLNDAHYDWPSVAEVRDYRRQVRELVCAVIDHAPLTLPIGWEHPWWAIVMGIEHERIHLETSSVLIRQHELSFVKPHPDWQPGRDSGPAPENRLQPVAAGVVRLGRDVADPVYGWDNEYGRHEAAVPAFEAARYLTSNGEFREFVEDNGYSRPEFWDEEGRGWLGFTAAAHPTFWRRRDGEWRLRLMTEEVPMPWDWPVEVNCLEARAFCRWKAAKTGLPVRLPTEDEWRRLYDACGLADIPADRPAAANLHLDHGASSCPVNRFAHGEFYDVTGNVWQWTETPIYPFDGFAVHPWYDDFSTPTFDDRHNLMKGGSWIACGNESRADSRYAFRRHFFQHAGFRYIVSAAPAQVPGSLYETDRLLSEYAEFHYGDLHYGVANFSQSLAKLCVAAMGDRPARRALDLGCAAGRATFELATHFERVTGIDFSARFIGLGVQMAEQGRLRYTRTDEGELVSYCTRTLAEHGLEETRSRVEFFQGDACNLKPQFSGYDLVLAANLIDRLYNPALFLGQIHERINPGGLLVLTSPYTWLTEHTPREAWIGGFKRDGETVTTLDGLQALLGRHFRRVGEAVDVPFVIRETKRKFQHSVAEVTVWERV
ncbi:5-histidylcysteine sulfoxide synthase/putative 4-mercaptohistidine N1-methyltransferase [Fluviicoccus keumensis]|uniref:5-histidylcysteine sulfoxide synthase/putative 4-mercaptohistidine N1-methyltransferase n=1 Tax=Fluviicoccus keumensis TaxID=1435465 RepID=A0A4Q7YL57_9GAMM|nr:5-histidylcysteine sulfoxide synthase [Fluviicoccus keumensis]RZU38422.1 5-histidylcysteine sulfoxide synthase/putative 4-mercaptohistidine N1-methyltransferase [Fluviicoccus keumensis]